MNYDLFSTSLLQSLILALLAYGVMIPFRFLNFPDLSAEGAYPLGAALGSLTLGYSPLLAFGLSILGSGLLTVCTGLIHIRFKINSLLAGIILSTAAFSVNLRLLGKPNLPLFDTAIPITLPLLLLILSGCMIPFALFLRTDFGLRFRAVGLNPALARQQGMKVGAYTLLGLFIAGGFFGLSGNLMMNFQQYMDVSMGFGIVIHGLASVMLGEALLGKSLLGPLVGAVLYQQIQGLALTLGLAPSDLNFFTGVMMLSIIAFKKGEAHV